MRKMIKPRKVRKTSLSTGLVQYKDGKDDFKNIKEAYDYVNRNGLNNALIGIGDGNIPMNQREYQVTLPNLTITDGGIHRDVQEKRLNDLISHSEIHPITGKPQVIGAKSVYPEFDIITLGQQIPWKNFWNSLKSELQFLNSNLYSDNPVINAYATLARKYNLPDKARLPYLIRRIKSNQLNIDNSGNIILNGRFSHTNFTYDRPVVSHSKGAWDNAQQTLLINPRKIVKNNKFGSIEPSDMFTIKDPEGGLVVSPRDVINITANPTSRRLSKKYGIKTISSDELKNQELKALKKDHDTDVQNFGKRFKLAKSSRTEINRDYWNAVHDLQKLYGKPKTKDVRLLEKLTGQKSGISDLSDLQNFKNVSRDRILDTPISEIDQVIDNLPKFGNGRRFNWENYNDQNGITFPYTNFFYDPATPAESLFKFKHGKDSDTYIMKKIVKPYKARKPSASTDVPSFARGKDQIFKSPARLQRRKKNELGEFDTGKDDIIKSVNYSTNKFWNQGSPQRLYHYFISNGIPRNQALGIIGNIAQESAFDPNKSNGNAFGYVQNGKMIQDYINTVYGGSGEKEQMKYLVDGLKHQLPVAKNYRQLQNRFDKFNELAREGVTPENVASLFDRIYERSEGVDDLQRRAYAGNYSQMIPENSDLVQTPGGYGYIRSYNEDGSVNVLDNDRKTRTFKSLELPEVVVTADRRPYKSYFDGSVKNTLNTIGSMFGLGYDGGKDDHRYYDYIIGQSMLGNPTAKRMTGEDDRYIPAFGQGDRSNLVIGSYGNYATPSVMNIGGELMYTPNPWEVFPEWMVQNQSFRFNNPNDAIDFAESYKYSSPAFPEFFGVDNSVNYNKGKDSGIHIKKKNRGKFTAAAKRAGMGVQAYARKILNAPKGKYSSTLRKRANFAANAAKWH